MVILMASFFSVSWAKSSSSEKEAPKNIRFVTGLLKNITCTYSGTLRTSTGPTVGEVDFPADPANTVCDPLTNTPSTDPLNGLLGKLILRTPEMGPKVTSVMDYLAKGQKLEQNLYFADVNVPTQQFTKGFSTEDGQLLVDGNGQKLTENFAIEYSSILKLADGDKEGNYEISLLSDDGARLFVKENDVWKELTNNDGEHATRMGCPYRTVEMKKDKELPIKLLYYQGPKYHIANVMLWKRHKKAKSWADPSRHSLCGYEGNNFFYNSTTSKKLAGIKFLENTGWDVVPKDNFKMPPKVTNPCAEEELTMSNFSVSSYNGTTATISWSTNFPASSRLRVSNVNTGEEIFTDLDPTLVTDHVAVINGMIPGVTYQVQTISVDAKGREVRSVFTPVP
jgi:hypothetical protein